LKEREREKESREKRKRDFISRFHELVKVPIDPSSIYETGETISLVWKTECIAISLVRRLTFPISLSVQVEIFMPIVPTEDMVTRDTDLPSKVIIHMEYLRSLLDASFDLQVIGEECLLVASKDFREIPSPEIIDMLLPPECNFQ